MKRYLPLLLILIGVIVLTTVIIGRTEPKADGITVYAYDSFVSEWGPGPELARLFTEETGIEVAFVSPGDAGQVLQRLIAEKKSPVADVAVGIDNNLFPKAEAAGVLLPYRSGAADIAPELRFPGDLLTPYDYGYFAFIWDSEALADPPRSFAELADPRFREKIIIMDPRTSTPGLGLLLWSAALYGEQASGFWSGFAPNLLTVSSGWDSGYGLFIEGEAPLVLSYTTSPAYHLEYEGTERYRALLFPEGHYLQVEGAGIVAGTKNRKEAGLFIDFLLGIEAQELLPLTNWMYPVRGDARLPDSFRLAPEPGKSLRIDPAPGEEEIDSLVRMWNGVLTK